MLAPFTDVKLQRGYSDGRWKKQDSNPAILMPVLRPLEAALIDQKRKGVD